MRTQLLALALVLVPLSASARFHLWQITEIYSNADGSVQFVEAEVVNPIDDENLTAGHNISSSSVVFPIPSNLPSTTITHHMLFATPAFASQSGCSNVTPDFTFAGPNFMSTVAADLINLANVNSFSYTAGELPIDGVNSLNEPFGSNVRTTAPASPTNWAGHTCQVDPTASCRKAQLKAGAKLCKSEFACHAKYAKNPGSDPLGAYREMCLAKAADKFTAAYDAAALKAENKELACGTNAPASEPLAALGENVDAVVVEVDAINPSYAPLESAWLGAAGTACSAAVAAQSANAGKPDADKLQTALEKAALKLDAAAQKAADKAANKGVVFAPPLDIPAFHDLVDEAIDTARSELNGD